MKKPSNTLISDLQARGMIHDIMHGTEAQLTRERTGVYLGVDATAASMHVGHLAALMVLKQLQKAGHRPYIILGGGTSLVGDPAFRTKGRDDIGIEKIRYNQECIQKQVEKLFDVGEKGDTVVLNNYDWLHQIPFLTFLRDVGKYVTVNYMIGKEAVKKRMETGMTYTEFAYQLLQGYDFYHLYTQHDVKMQIGGADQWANITTGAELIRKKAGGTAFGLTLPLLLRADGTKFGKTADGENVWLDATMTSPYHFYQFWINRSDEEAQTLLRRMTLHSLSTLEAWEAQHAQAPHQRLLQKELGKALTTLVHGKKVYEEALHATEFLFGQQAFDLSDGQMTEKTFLEALAGVATVNVSSGEMEKASDVLTLLTATTQGAIFQSKREAREMIGAGAVRVNKVKVHTPDQLLEPLPRWFDGRYLLVQKGKKNYYLICCNKG
ncbi:MAG: tyrosine--tRNA ligase [Bacteroidota bacterium]